VTFNQSTIDFGITDNLHGGHQKFLHYRLPRQFEVSDDGGTLQWPAVAYDIANHLGPKFLIGPGPYQISNNINSESAPYSHDTAALVIDLPPTDAEVTALAPSERKHEPRAYPAQADVDPQEPLEAHNTHRHSAEK
jgi:hypothetical protein